MLRLLSEYLPRPTEIKGRYVEPFVGGGAVFLYVRPGRAVLGDSNAELIDLYLGLREDPTGVWTHYSSFGATKEDYHEIRSWRPETLSQARRTARLLYLNRTCFKGNWRHNSKGQFNVGYGGQSRRWVLSEGYLVDVAKALRDAEIRCTDFESVIDDAHAGDYVFLDPPYRRGERELINDHYTFKHFSFSDQRRLAATLGRARQRGVAWSMTNSSHPDVLALFHEFSAFVPPSKHLEKGHGEAIIFSGGW